MDIPEALKDFILQSASDAWDEATRVERERCAKIAESRFTTGTVTKNKKGEPYLTGQAAIYAARQIASAIRTPPTGEEQ